MTAESVTLVATIVLAVTAVVGTIVAISQLSSQGRHAHADAALNTLWHLEETWMSPAMVARRQKAAQSITAGRVNQKNDFDQYVAAVLDFFDLVGFLVRTVPLDLEVAWNRFYYPTVNYWFLTRLYVESEQRGDSRVWEDFVLLGRKLMQMEAHKRGCAVEDLTPTAGELEEFLKHEREGS